MITRVRRDLILSGEDNLTTLIVKANIAGYPFIEKDNKVYQIKTNNNYTRIKHYDVTEQVEII
jgi:hypothetical protein